MLRSAGTATQVAAAAFPLLAPDGTVGAPSYATASQPGTGWYKSGPFTFTFTAGSTNQFSFDGNLNTLRIRSAGLLAWASTDDSTGTTDLSLFRDAADTFAQRRGVNAQTFRLYNTFTDTSNFERFEASWSGNFLYFGTSQLGTGVGRSFVFQTSGVARWQLTSTGHFIAQTDNSYDIGASGTNRPRNLYIGSAIFTTAPTAQAAGAYTVLATDNTVINSVASTLTLPAVGTSTGRKLRVVTTGANAIISNASNVVPITGGAAGTAILAATAGKWADLECNGANWIITAAN